MMTRTERTAAARQRQDELVEILTTAVFHVYMRDRIEASASVRRKALAEDAVACGAPSPDIGLAALSG